MSLNVIVVNVCVIVFVEIIVMIGMLNVAVRLVLFGVLLNKFIMFLIRIRFVLCVVLVSSVW